MPIEITSVANAQELNSTQDLSILVFSYNRHQDLLPHALRSILHNAPQHRELTVVWDDYVRERPIDFDQIRDTIDHDFKVVLQSEIYAWPEAIGRWGWIKQQLAKLLCATYTASRYAWIVDGDVLVTGNPDLFDETGRPYLRYDSSRTTNPSYIKFIQRYLNIHDIYCHDFVGSSALFDTQVCRKIDQQATAVFGQGLVECVNHCIQQPDCDPLPFSEFETYASWIYNHDRHSVVLADKNWNYCPAQRYWHHPLQIMWHLGPAARGKTLEDLAQWHLSIKNLG